MKPVVPSTTVCSRWPTQFGRNALVVLSLFACLLLGACATTPFDTRLASDLPPLELGDHSVSVDDVADRIETPDLLALDDDMRDFVERYTGHVHGSRQRLITLHRAVVGAGALDMQYDPFAEGTAREAFHRGSANCLSYANMFVALAREADLDASYQWMEVSPQWTRKGERLMVRLHVAVVVKVQGGAEFMVDIDPLSARDIAESREISDDDAAALYHNNIAMDALANGELETAWLHAARALQISPRESDLWVNIGAIYRKAGQEAEAERNYLYALQLDPRERSAMNNLVVLYGLQGRTEEREYWRGRVEYYRDRNPYYHAWLGDKAADSGDWHEALQHYGEALNLMPEDSGLLYATGLIYYQMDDLPTASGYIEQAIEYATLNSEIKTYQMQLDSVRREQLAGT